MIFELVNKIQEYQWGSKDFIPELLNIEADGKPKAELWMGAHPKAPSKIFYKGKQTSLFDLIQYDSVKILGPEVTRRFNDQLPFLLKVLSSSQPLSIQSHPDIKQAREGFKKENDAGIPQNAFNRNYKDENHKPELMCALTEFVAMCGFQPVNEIFDRIDYLKLQNELSDNLEDSTDSSEADFKQMFFYLMNMDKELQKKLVHKILKVIEKSIPRDENESLVFHWIKKLSTIYSGDIGVISPLFLNVIKLQPGQALFLEARTLHAYLHGSGIELMANSDNVLRGGLTPKNVDVPELMKMLKFRHKLVDIIIPEKISENESVYYTTADEFQLSVIKLRGEFNVEDIKGPEIILCIEGDMNVNEIHINKGGSVFIPFSEKHYKIKGYGTFYRVIVP